MAAKINLISKQQSVKMLRIFRLLKLLFSREISKEFNKTVNVNKLFDLLNDDQ